jgi:uncharacterized protein YuzE
MLTNETVDSTMDQLSENFTLDELIDKSGVIIDYDKDGNIVEIEVLNASKT